MAETAILERTAIVRHGRRLEYLTIGWNTLEGLIAVIAGAVAGSVSLIGFGIDSFIEVTSGSALLWRMSVDAGVHSRERNERRALQVVGLSMALVEMGISAGCAGVPFLAISAPLAAGLDHFGLRPRRWPGRGICLARSIKSGF